MSVDIRDSRFGAFATAYREAVKGDPVRSEVAEKYLENLQRRGMAYLPTLRRDVSAGTMAAIRAAGFRVRMTRKAVLDWFDGE